MTQTGKATSTGTRTATQPLPGPHQSVDAASQQAQQHNRDQQDRLEHRQPVQQALKDQRLAE